MSEKNSEELRFWVDTWKVHIKEKGYWDANLKSMPIMDYRLAREREAREHANRILAMCDLPRDSFAGKTVVDIGAGPVCALEFSGAGLGYVVDPCSDMYRDQDLLIKGPTPVHYFNSGAESIPLPSDSIDLIVAFNCLDHVDDLDKVLAEIRRILRPGGLLLVNIELDHEPTACEPITISVESWAQLTAQHRLRPRSTKIYAPNPDQSKSSAYMHHNSRWIHGAYEKQT